MIPRVGLETRSDWQTEEHKEPRVVYLASLLQPGKRLLSLIEADVGHGGPEGRYVLLTGARLKLLDVLPSLVLPRRGYGDLPSMCHAARSTDIPCEATFQVVLA